MPAAVGKKLFVFPSSDVFSRTTHGAYRADAATYSQYNYLRKGWISGLKRKRFEIALNIARPYFGQGAIDMGCADGILLPSLSKYFSHVAAVDPNETFLETARDLVRSSNYANVELFYNQGKSFDELRAMLGGKPYRVLFLLETLEHVGTVERMYESRAEFVEGCLSLLTDDGVMIISVPRMVGPYFLGKYAIQAALRRVDEPHTLGELWRAGILQDTEALEPRWKGGHIGFNHLKLDNALTERFRIIRRFGNMTSIFYVVGKRTQS